MRASVVHLLAIGGADVDGFFGDDPIKTECADRVESYPATEPRQCLRQAP